jgi:hypothetical protein
MTRNVGLAVALVLALVGCGGSGGVSNGRPTPSVTASPSPSPTPEGSDPQRLPLAGEVSERFVSFAVDVDQLVGGTFWDPAGGSGVVAVPPYDFSRARLRTLAGALSPAYLRLGGSASDQTFYDLSDVPGTPPPPFALVLTREQFDAANQFAIDLGLEVVFTINAGPGPRDADGVWQPTNAEALLRYGVERGYPLAMLEFGNEPNLFAVRAGIANYRAVDYARDLAVFQTLRDRVAPGMPIFAAGNIYTRTQGENIIRTAVFGPRMSEMLPLVGSTIDGVNYHYYAAISTRCPQSGPRVTVGTALDPAYVDGIDEAGAMLDALRDAHAAGRPIWLTETGGQSCGGQVGVADRFANTFWSLNTLARLARRGHQVVVRQTLSGSTYGLVDEISLAPRPDYWAMLLWRRLMGTRVLQVPARAGAETARVYAHCQRGGRAGAVTVLVLNLDEDEPFDLVLSDLGLTPPAEVYAAGAAALSSGEMVLNGSPLAVSADGTLPALVPVAHREPILTLAPASWAFAIFPHAGMAACLER